MSIGDRIEQQVASELRNPHILVLKDKDQSLQIKQLQNFSIDFNRQ